MRTVLYFLIMVALLVMVLVNREQNAVIQQQRALINLMLKNPACTLTPPELKPQVLDGSKLWVKPTYTYNAIMQLKPNPALKGI